MVIEKMESVVEWANSLIPLAREAFGLDEEEYEVALFYQSENTTYKVVNKKTGEKMMLRVCEPGYHTQEELKSEITFMQAIKEYSDIVIPEPIAGVDKEYVQKISSEGDKDYFAVMFTFVKGSAPQQDNLGELGEYFYKLGQVTGKMHVATIESEISSKVVRPTWTPEKLFGEEAALGNYRLCNEFSETDLKMFDQVEKVIKTRLQIYGKTRDNYGVVHSDCRLANLLMDGDDIAVIDFDDSGFCWFLNDYGSAFSFIEDSEYVPMLSENWERGYESVRHLSEEDKAEFETFILIRRLLLQGFLETHTESEAVKDGIGNSYAKGTYTLAKRFLEHNEGLVS